jgi:anti-sigma factor RsiW
MVEPMTEDRFAALLEAYGAEPRRWPEDERAATQAFARTDPRAAALMAAAADIDDLLYGHRVPAPSPAFAAAVMARAPRRRWTRARLWWAAFGLGIAGAGGALAGSAATAALERPMIAVPLYGHDEATAFGDLIEEAGR